MIGGAFYQLLELKVYRRYDVAGGSARDAPQVSPIAAFAAASTGAVT